VTYLAAAPPGYYAPGLVPLPAPNGTFAAGPGAANFTLCSPGSFQPRSGAAACLPCPVGYMCPDAGLALPVICPAGAVCERTGLRGPSNPCPPGHYCRAGTKSSSAVSGMASSSANSSSGADWLRDSVTGLLWVNSDPSAAVAGHWTQVTRQPPAFGNYSAVAPPAGGNISAEVPIPCPIGYYCSAGAASAVPLPRNVSTPQACFEGFFCPRGSVTPQGSGPCPSGYYCPDATNAVQCPAGHACPGVGNTAARECPPGTYSPASAASNCTLCDAGSICPGWGRLLPEPCPAGFVCASLGLSAPVVLCPPGYSCAPGTLTLDPSDPTDRRPVPCPAGTFCLGGVAHAVTIEWIARQPWGATAPQNCTEGTYCEPGSVSPKGSGPCFEGHYCPPGSTAPIETPIGSFAASEGSVVPVLCFPGTYAPLRGAGMCRVCPAGYTCPSYGTYEPTICEAGTYRSLADSVTCRPCPAGTFSPYAGVPDISQCLPCPGGRICGVQGMTNLTAVSALLLPLLLLLLLLVRYCVHMIDVEYA
jgi:Tyrosine-protein kinase ephrin type A/B receptor-like